MVFDQLGVLVREFMDLGGELGFFGAEDFGFPPRVVCFRP